METAKLKKSVRIRQAKEAAKAAGNAGPNTSKLINVPTSPRKMRLVADLIRGQKVNRALAILKFEAKQGAARLEKLLLSAVSNWQANNPDTRLEDADLIVKSIFVDSGRQLKRLRPAPQGRAHRIRKRSNHVTIVIDNLAATSVTTVEAPVKQETKVETKPKAKKAEAETKEAKPKKTKETKTEKSK
jgi:large subunit ribosomal protein L22